MEHIGVWWGIVSTGETEKVFVPRQNISKRTCTSFWQTAHPKRTILSLSHADSGCALCVPSTPKATEPEHFTSSDDRSNKAAVVTTFSQGAEGLHFKAIHSFQMQFNTALLYRKSSTLSKPCEGDYWVVFFLEEQTCEVWGVLWELHKAGVCFAGSGRARTGRTKGHQCWQLCKQPERCEICHTGMRRKIQHH